jgi:hypothetical protein
MTHLNDILTFLLLNVFHCNDYTEAQKNPKLAQGKQDF